MKATLPVLVGALAGVALGRSALGQSAPAGQPPGSGLTFTRQIAPFEVRDPSGRPYGLPFLGGLDVPRPQLVDIDADGDLDLFVQEYSNAVMHFENTGSKAAPRFEWRTSRFQDLDIGEWFRFVDIDADGLLDLIAERPYSHIRYYRNSGSATSPRFTDAGAILDAAGEPLFFDRQNIPALVDLDCDNRLDLFAGRVEGTVTHYEALERGSPRFALIQEFWEGIEIVGRIGDVGTRRHGANSLAFADFDADRDVDLFWGDFFEPGLLLIENIGRTCSTPSFQVDPIPVPYADTRTSGYNSPVPVDLDGDGLLDLVVGVIGGAFNPVRTSADNLHYWKRASPTAFERVTTRLVDGIDLGSETTPAVADFDGDGDLDIVAGNKTDTSGDAARLVLLVNDGRPGAPRFRETDPFAPMAGFHFAPAAGDLDGDGDVDLLVGTWNDGIRYLRNESSAAGPRFVADASGNVQPPRLTHASPALADLDGDGDLDLLIGQASGVVTFYRNAGTPRAPRWELADEALEGIKVGRRSAPAFVDVDGDGLFDLVIGREEGGAFLFRNAGARNQPRFVRGPPLAMALPPLSKPVFADLDGDGTVDLLSGSASGGLLFFKGSR